MQILMKFTRKAEISRWFSSMQYPIDYEFIQRSSIPTMHFQNSLPRLPIPTLGLTCERYLAAQKPLLIDEAYRKTENNVNQFKSRVGKQLQKLLKEYDRKNKHTSYINEFWYNQSLVDRKCLPINFNPVLIMQNDPNDSYNDQVIRSANLIISSLRFYKSLKYTLLEPEVYHLNPSRSDTALFRAICSSLPESISSHGAYLFKAYPLDMSQYPKLFNSTRIPEADKDRIVSNLQGNHITVQHKGHFYAFAVLDKHGEILKPEKILAKLKMVLNDNVEKNKFPLGILTTLERNKWATIRHELAEDGNELALKIIDSALFNVCLDEVSLAGDVYATVRNFLHGDGTNRWFDKSFSIQVSKDGVAAVNFENSWGDGVAVLRYVQDVHTDSIENPFVHPHSVPYNDDINSLIRLDMHLNDKLRVCINEAKREYDHFCKSLDVDYLYLENSIGKNVCKRQGISPDAVMQLAFQIAYHKMTGKFVPTYESCSTAAFKHGRTDVVRPCTTLTKAFTLSMNSISKPSINELKLMISDCARHHNQLTREAAMGQGFDRHLFVLKQFADKANLASNIFDDPYYEYLNHYILTTSTLNSSAIYAGGFGPVERDGLGVAYIIRDEALGVLVTSYPPYQNGSEYVEALRDTFRELMPLFDVD